MGCDAGTPNRVARTAPILRRGDRKCGDPRPVRILVERAAAVHVEHVGRPRAPDPDVPELAAAPEQGDAAGRGSASRRARPDRSKASRPVLARAPPGVEIARARREHGARRPRASCRARGSSVAIVQVRVSISADAEGDRPVGQARRAAGGQWSPVTAMRPSPRPGRVAPPDRDVALRGAGAERVVGRRHPSRASTSATRSPRARDRVERPPLGIDGESRRQDPSGRVGRLGVVGARLDAVDGDGPDAAARVREQDPERSDALLGPSATASRPAPRTCSRSGRENARRATTFRLRDVDPEETLVAGSLAGDRHQAVRADPADREPSARPTRATPSERQRATSTKWIRAPGRAPTASPGPRRRACVPSGETFRSEPAAEGADRTADLLERPRVQPEQQVAAVAVPHAHERRAGGCLLQPRRKRPRWARSALRGQAPAVLMTAIRRSGTHSVHRPALLACVQAITRTNVGRDLGLLVRAPARLHQPRVLRGARGRRHLLLPAEVPRAALERRRAAVARRALRGPGLSLAAVSRAVDGLVQRGRSSAWRTRATAAPSS